MVFPSPSPYVMVRLLLRSVKKIWIRYGCPMVKAPPPMEMLVEVPPPNSMLCRRLSKPGSRVVCEASPTFAALFGRSEFEGVKSTPLTVVTPAACVPLIASTRAPDVTITVGSVVSAAGIHEMGAAPLSPPTRNVIRRKVLIIEQDWWAKKEVQNLRGGVKSQLLSSRTLKILI